MALHILNIASQVLMALIEDHQAVEDEEGQVVIEEWKEEVSTMVLQSQHGHPGSMI